MRLVPQRHPERTINIDFDTINTITTAVHVCVCSARCPILYYY